MSSNKHVITELGCEDVQSIQNKLFSNKQILLIKFTADWCGPCKRIKDDCYNMFNELPDNIIVADLNVDVGKNIELYKLLKRKRQVNGIPTILTWYPDNDRAFWYVPDKYVVGGDINLIKEFFTTLYKDSLNI